MRSIKKLHQAYYNPIGDLITYTPLPSPGIQMIDPFLFLNHHGPQKYPPENDGLPFGPHPHRGMETVTFIIDGDIMHRDSGGHESVIRAGGVQWMTAGRGLIHEEVSSDEFREKGGNLEILQLWINLPAKLKMSPPRYSGLQKEEIPKVTMDNGRVNIDVIAGKWEEQPAAFDTLTDINLELIHFEEGGSLSLNIPVSHNIFFYVIRGSLEVNGQTVKALQLAEFNNDEEELKVKALQKSILLFGHAQPFNEPVVAQGPFVMNTSEEIREAYEDYRKGKFGSWG